MDVNEHERLSNITLRHKLKQRNSAFIAVLHFTVTVCSSTMSITHTIRWMKNGPSCFVYRDQVQFLIWVSSEES
jgi:hypothetical protein